MAKPNVLIRSKKAKAEELLNRNQLREADALLAEICRTALTDVESLTMRALIHRKLGLFKESEEFCRSALKLNPNFARAHFMLGSVLHSQERLDEAITCYQRAKQIQPDLADAHYLLGNALKEKGLFDEAAASYRAAIQYRPNFVEALCNLGTLLTISDKITEAAEVLNRAVKLRPNAHQIQSAVGRVLIHLKEADKAINHFKIALSLNPTVETASELIAPLEKCNRIEEAQALLDEFQPQAPNHNVFLLVATRLLRRKGQLQEALDIVNSIMQQELSKNAQSEILLLSGQLNDRLGNSELAFEQLAKGNLLAAQLDNSLSDNDYLQQVEHIGSYLDTSIQQVEVPETDGSEEQQPIFVYGFPRSGTTLLEQILDSHSRLQAMEEKPAMVALFTEFEKLTNGRANALSSLTPDEISHLRESYFAEVKRYLKREPGTILVDRMPLNTIYAHLIWRVFPKAKNVLAIRHPCDVCLSCFMQNFEANQATKNFYTLESTVELYASVMHTWQQCVKSLPLDYHQIRYEDLVANFELETRRLLDYLGVGWDENVRNHTHHAIKRGQIRTASYHQVVQPIYQHAKYRWKRYAKQLESVLPTLQPFIEYFGYADPVESARVVHLKTSIQ